MSFELAIVSVAILLSILFARGPKVPCAALVLFVADVTHQQLVGDSTIAFQFHWLPGCALCRVGVLARDSDGPITTSWVISAMLAGTAAVQFVGRGHH